MHPSKCMLRGRCTTSVSLAVPHMSQANVLTHVPSSIGTTSTSAIRPIRAPGCINSHSRGVAARASAEEAVPAWLLAYQPLKSHSVVLTAGNKQVRRTAKPFYRVPKLRGEGIVHRDSI